jgi:peptidoglycan LD-endopeptidase CwlK
MGKKKNFVLGARSKQRLTGVHPDLVKVVERAIEITEIDFTVLEGLRTLATQKKYVANGASKTMRSRHLTGHAVDLAPMVSGKVSWHWPHYHLLAPAMKQAAAELGIPIEWGGDWRSFKDGPHWQLPWKNYPA